MILFEDNVVEVFLVGNPRKKGHISVFSKKHFKDIMEVDENTLIHSMKIAQKAMQVLKEVLGAESVYLCTMCDGPSNHYHLQLIPRYSHEERGSKNFVAPRVEYVHDDKLTETIREKLK